MSALQNRASVPFTFNGLPLAAIPHDDDLWLTGEDIGRALEYSDPRKGIKTLYERNTEELDRYSIVLKLPVAYGDAASTEGEIVHEEGTCGVNLRPHVGGAASTRMQPVRVFSEEGVMVLTMLSSQPKAAEFRAWAVGVLKAYRHGNLVISNPANRDRLLETCIKEVRFGNQAAIHTLVHHFGYPVTIADIPAPAGSPTGGSRLAKKPPLVAWFVETFLPALGNEVRIGGGPLLDSIRAKRSVYRAWKVVKKPETAFALEHRAADLMEIVAQYASEDGVEGVMNAATFVKWVNDSEIDLEAIGWSRKFSHMSCGTQIWILALKGGAE